MIKTGLIGYPLEHSQSPQLFEEIFQKQEIRDASYQLFPLENLVYLHDLIANHPDLIGLNVTIPHKVDILSYLDEIDNEALSVNAVNTIKIDIHGKKPCLKGYNTDINGFESMLETYAKTPVKGALVLGSGGASKAVTFVLKKHNIPFKVVSRNPSKGTLVYDEISNELLNYYPLIINCTPAGMYPQTGEAPPIPFELLNEQHFLFDLIYNPAETKLMREAKMRGAEVYNGLTMLKNQALASWKIWQGTQL